VIVYKTATSRAGHVAAIELDCNDIKALILDLLALIEG
jgi:hypothetical protein